MSNGDTIYTERLKHCDINDKVSHFLKYSIVGCSYLAGFELLGIYISSVILVDTKGDSFITNSARFTIFHGEKLSVFYLITQL